MASAATQNDSGRYTLNASGALAWRRLVKFDGSGDAAYAGAGEGASVLGVTEEAVAAADDPVEVALLNKQGSHVLTAALAILKGENLYPAASGKVSNVPSVDGEQPVFIALEAAAGDGAWFECMVHPVQSVDELGSFAVTGGAGNIAAADLVYKSDQASGVAVVLKADASNERKLAVGICPAAITAAALGRMCSRYLLPDVNTSAGAVGDPVYLDPTTPGAWTLTRPPEPSRAQIVGSVIKAATALNHGAIYFQLPGTILDPATEVVGAGGNLLAADLCYLSDQTSGSPVASKALGNAATTLAQGIVPAAITAAAKGRMLKKYLLVDVDTSAAGAVGSPVYLSAAAAGAWTLTKPATTNYAQIVGRVAKKATAGNHGAIQFDLPGQSETVHDHSCNAEGGAIPLILGAAAGYKIARSAAPVAVTGTLAIATGLATVVAVIVCASSDLDGDTFAGVSALIEGAAGSFTAKCWKNNADGDATMVAANAAKNIHWIAIGT